MDALTIVFDDWEQVLASTLPPDLRKPYREAIVKFRYWLRQRCVLLVDDVMTTGAMLNECARMLKKAGARTVWAVTVGREV